MMKMTLSYLATVMIARPTLASFGMVASSSSSRVSLSSFYASKQRVGGSCLHMSSSISSSSTIDDDLAAAVEKGVSRLATLQTLLAKHGAPGSRNCAEAGSLEATFSLSAEEETLQLHPHLYPIAKSSSSSDSYICALRRAFAEDADYVSSSNAPWPIVEAKTNGPGMRLLALNSEHLMRRMAAEADFNGDSEVVSIYNEGLGQGTLKDKDLDALYEAGSVEKLGYGVEKYVLLRVGPFPDLYESMAWQHAKRGDEASSLIAAETSNGKFPGFGSTFAFYAKLLSTFPKREEETRDAARMCLRLPIPSAGLDVEDFVEIAQMAQLASPEDDSPEQAMEKLSAFYDKIREHEQEDEQTKQNMTPEQVAIEEANHVLNQVTLKAPGGKSCPWQEVRSKLGDIYASGGREDMARFVDPSRTPFQ